MSQLEFVGCRKILKSVPFGRVDFDVLRHVAEEASHAFLLKSLVDKSEFKARQTWDGSGLGAVGWRYFQALDRAVSRLEDPVGAYAYPAVSWIVERRVMQVYPLYISVTRDKGVKRILTQILAQEQRHGAQFAELPFSEGFRARAIEIEGLLWDRFRAELSEWWEAREAFASVRSELRADPNLG